MISYALDAHLEGEWIEVGQGEFADVREAIHALNVFKKEFDYTTDELRIRRISGVNPGALKRCSNCDGVVVSGPDGLGCRDCGTRYLPVKRNPS